MTSRVIVNEQRILICGFGIHFVKTSRNKEQGQSVLCDEEGNLEDRGNNEDKLYLDKFPIILNKIIPENC